MFVSFVRNGVRPRSLPDRRANTFLVSVEDVNPQVRHRMRGITGCLTPYDRDLPAPAGLRHESSVGVVPARLGVRMTERSEQRF